ncbi:sulfite exporter TauE/SafE family protein [Sulfurospirillum sp. 1612]|uniref:sulfite exporter TauE/SafE family protein n=1 Tax=Sulfurospirillum sp. 1612 TaxID=3094835 RepID=UPI002F940896
MSISIIIIIGCILLFCSTIQGIVGFAFNIFAIPLLIWSGLELSEAISITSIPILVQSATSTYKLRAHVEWKDVGIASVFRYLSIPIGIYLLTLISGFDKETIKQFVGIAILLVVASQLFLKVKPREHIHFFWTFLSFFTSGITLGMVSMGGPPAVLWVMAHKWSAITSRAFLSALFFFAAPMQIALLYYHFGATLLNDFLLGLFFSPVVIIGTLIGVKLGDFLDREMLRKIVISLLILTSVVSILSPYLKG